MVKNHDMNKPDHIQPNLEKAIKDNPFRVPDGYFESFPSRLNEKILTENLKSKPTRSPIVWEPYLAAAILIVIALVGGKFVLDFTRQQSALRLQAEITKTVDEELYSISEETIWEFMESDLTGSDQNSDATTNEALDYLLNEDIAEDELFDIF